MGMSNKTKTYSIPAQKIFDTLGECLNNSDHFSELTLDNENLIIVAVTKAVANTHGEKIIVKMNENKKMKMLDSVTKKLQ